MDFHTVLALAVLLGAGLQVAQSQWTLRVSLFWVGLLAYVALAAIQVLFTPADAAGEQRLFAGLQWYGLVGGAAMILSAQYLLRDRDWSSFVDCMIVGAVAAGALVVAEAVTNGASHSLFPGLYGAPGLLRERPAGAFNLPNYFGVFAALATLLAIHRFWTIRGRWRKLLVGVSTAVIAAALFLSFSRGALIALGGGLVYVAYSRSRPLGVVVAAGLLMLAVLGSSLFYEARLGLTNPNDTLHEAQAGLETSDEGRLAGGAVSIRLFERDPIFGIGFGQYHFVSRIYESGNEATFAHNWYANVLAEQGVVGIGLVAIVASALVGGVRRAAPERRQIAVAVLLGYAIANLFTESPTDMSASSVAWLVIGGAFASAGSALAKTRLNAVRRVGRSRNPRSFI
ncbi:MAG: O-antigen ligase family protein [Chloroflexi bacterium]|nr:O-antigen ligase family protein [Chloroflexota bacterium]